MELSVVLNPLTPPLTGRKVVSFNPLIESHLEFLFTRSFSVSNGTSFIPVILEGGGGVLI